MSKYTMELRKVCDYYGRDEVENWFKNYNIEDYLTNEQIQVVNNAGLWNKDKLAKKIVNHYFVREIGFETPALFKHYAQVTMEEIMEEKLPVIYSKSIYFDPLVNVDYTETFERTINSEGTANSQNEGHSESSSNSDSLNINNGTPQKRITKQDLNTGAYASNVGQNESNINDETNTNNTTESASNQDTEERYTKTQRGNSGVSATAQKMIEQYRDIIRAVDKEIIEKLQILFMGLY